MNLKPSLSVILVLGAWAAMSAAPADAQVAVPVGGGTAPSPRAPIAVYADARHRLALYPDGGRESYALVGKVDGRAWWVHFHAEEGVLTALTAEGDRGVGSLRPGPLAFPAPRVVGESRGILLEWFANLVRADIARTRGGR